MDLLSVILHEYGHVLGLDHDSDTHSLMSEDLKAGIRHTVSQADMDKLWALLKDKLPSDPTLPLATSLFFGFTRREQEETGTELGIDLGPLAPTDTNVVMATPAPIYAMQPQYATALHTGLYNGGFSVTDTLSSDFGWQSRGEVVFDATEVHIAEDNRAMSGLTQTFIKPQASRRCALP